jgi:hypothetical protein
VFEVGDEEELALLLEDDLEELELEDEELLDDDDEVPMHPDVLPHAAS